MKEKSMPSKRLQIPAGLMEKLLKHEAEDVIVSSYFITKGDPQMDAKPPEYRCRPDDLTYISSWLATALFCDLQPVLLIDKMDKSLIALLETRGVIVIQANLGPMSTNDERFFCYLELLETIKFGHVLFTDVSDVLFKKNPFDFPEMKKKICLGKDVSSTPLVGNNRWMVNKIQKLVNLNNKLLSIDEIKNFVKSPLVNAGVIGGSLTQAKEFIKDVVTFLEKCPDEGNWNMIAVNFAASKLEKDTFFMGKPFTSEFKGFNYEFDGYVVHK